MCGVGVCGSRPGSRMVVRGGGSGSGSVSGSGMEWRVVVGLAFADFFFNF